MQRGRGRGLRSPRPEDMAFVEEVERAEAFAEMYVTANLVALSRTDPRAAVAWLERHSASWRSSEAASSERPMGPPQGTRPGKDGIEYISSELFRDFLDRRRSGVPARPVALVDPSLREEVLYSDFDGIDREPPYNSPDRTRLRDTMGT